jgi:hypothetical protein
MKLLKMSLSASYVHACSPTSHQLFSVIFGFFVCGLVNMRFVLKVTVESDFEIYILKFLLDGAVFS